MSSIKRKKLIEIDDKLIKLQTAVEQEDEWSVANLTKETYDMLPEHAVKTIEKNKTIITKLREKKKTKAASDLMIILIGTVRRMIRFVKVVSR